MAMMSPDKFSVVAADVTQVQDAMVGKKDSPFSVYTPISLANINVLSGPIPSAVVYFRGGTVDGQTVEAEAPAGVVPGARVVLGILTTPDPRYAAGLPGSLIGSSWPIIDGEQVQLTGCWRGDKVPGVKALDATIRRMTSRGGINDQKEAVQQVPLKELKDIAARQK